MKRFLVVLAVVSLILSAASGVALADDPWKCGVIDKVVGSPSGDYDVMFRSTNCGNCVMVKMVDGRLMEWKYCEEDSRSWKDIQKRDQ